MTRDEGVRRALRVARGAVAASAITLAGMAGLAALVIYAGLDEGALTALNQALKLVSIALGTLFAVGIGGEKGLITGALVGMIYILAGYGFYSLIDGTEVRAAVMAVEELVGALAGGVSGAICVNIKPRRRA